VPEKRYLMTPGPTPAPPEVLAAIAQPVIHHRGPDFKKLYADCLGRLREIFRTESEVLLFGGSGTGAITCATPWARFPPQQTSPTASASVPQTSSS
jgi:aspartate aminotransferase-like enzyme